MGLRLITPPAVEPVSVNDIKQALRIDHTDDDVILVTHVASAREFVERRIQSQVAVKTWEFVIDAFPEAEIALPLRPVSSVTSIKYDDVGGVEQTVNPSTYVLDNVSRDHWVFTSSSWPVAMDSFNSVRVRFVAGYSDPTLIPPSIKAAIILKTKELYDGEDTKEAVHNLLTNHYSISV